MLPRARDRVRRPARAWAFSVYRAAVVVAVVLALAVAPLQLVRPDIDEAPALALTEVPASAADAESGVELDAWTVDLGDDGGPRPPVPGKGPRPAKGQKKAPCDPKFEVEASGFCWLPVQARPPECPPQTVAYAGQCLLPLGQARAPPVSVDAGSP